MKLKTLLIDIRNLIGTKDKWTQDTWAKDAAGNKCRENSPDAVCYCLVGAIRRCTDGPDYEDAYIAIRKCLGACSNSCLVEFNDTHTYEQVIAAVDAAIAVET